MTAQPGIVAADEEAIPTSKVTAVPDETEAIVIDHPERDSPNERPLRLEIYGHTSAGTASAIVGLNGDMHADDLPVLHVRQSGRSLA